MPRIALDPAEAIELALAHAGLSFVTSTHPNQLEQLAAGALRSLADAIAVDGAPEAQGWLEGVLADARPRSFVSKGDPAHERRWVRDRELLRECFAYAVAEGGPRLLLASGAVVTFASGDERDRVFAELAKKTGAPPTGAPIPAPASPATESWHLRPLLPATWRRPRERDLAAVATLALLADKPPLPPRSTDAPDEAERLAKEARGRRLLELEDWRAMLAKCDTLAAPLREVARELARGLPLEGDRLARLWLVVEGEGEAAPADATRPAPTASEPEVPVNRLRVTRTHARITFRGVTEDAPLLKGWRDLAKLLARRHEDVSLAELEPLPEGVKLPAFAPSAPLLDPEALEALRNAAEDAREVGNEEKAAELEAELLRAYRPGGEPKRFDNPEAEKLRRKVYKRIREAIGKLPDALATLREHLHARVSVTAALTASYKPEALEAEWEVS